MQVFDSVNPGDDHLVLSYVLRTADPIEVSAKPASCEGGKLVTQGSQKVAPQIRKIDGTKVY